MEQMQQCAGGLFRKIIILHWNKRATFNVIIISCLILRPREHYLLKTPQFVVTFGEDEHSDHPFTDFCMGQYSSA